MALDDMNDFLSNVTGYHKAIEEEFEIAVNSEDPLQVRKLMEKKLATAIPGFVAELIKLAHFAENDNTRISAIKYGMQLYFKDSVADADPLTAMLDSLTDNSKKSEAIKTDTSSSD
jgi:hypothetical protein